MASGAVLGRYRQLYTRADREIQQWDALHVSAECLRTCTCAAQRSQGWLNRRASAASTHAVLMQLVCCRRRR